MTDQAQSPKPPEDTAGTCRGIRKDGKPCTSPIVLSNGYCSVHQDQAPAPGAIEPPSAVEDPIPEAPTQERPSTTTRRDLLQVDSLKKIAKGFIGWAIGSAAWDETKKLADPYDEPVKEFAGDLVDEVKGVIGDLKKLAEDVGVRVPGRSKAVARVHPLLPEMVRIPAGEFLMGSDPEEDGWAGYWEWEQPQHTLYLPEYEMARTPVTNAQYLQFVKATSHTVPDHWQNGKPPSGKEHHPVVRVSWYDAMEYGRWLSRFTGKPYRLPSEAEWEKGARGTDARIFPWGNRWVQNLCNTDEAGKYDTTPVGAYPEGASPYGLLDIAGNVWEWTISVWREDSFERRPLVPLYITRAWSSSQAGEDLYHPQYKYPYISTDGRENLEADEAAYRVQRGGSYYHDWRYARCAARNGNLPIERSYLTGFRVVVASTPSL